MGADPLARQDLDDTDAEGAGDYEDEDEDEDEDDGEEEEEGVEYEDDYYHPLSEMPEPLADVSTGYTLVSHALAGEAEGEEEELEMGAITQIAVGDKVEVLCGLRNAGDEPLHVAFITGSLNNPYSFGEYLTNFSETTVNRTVAPHSEISLDYKFDLPEFGIRVGPYLIALTVFYAAGSGVNALNHSNTFFNETIQATEGLGAMDSKSFFTLVLILAVCAVFFHMSMKKRCARPRMPFAVRAAARDSAGPDNCGVFVCAAGPPRRRRRRRPARRATWPTTPTRCPGISAAGRAARSGGDRMQLSCPAYACLPLGDAHADGRHG